MRMEDPKDFENSGFKQLSKLRDLCRKTFETINEKLEFNEGFMRIDIILTTQGELYVNEVEPWRSRKSCIINACSKSISLSLPWISIENKITAENIRNSTISHAVKCTCFFYNNRPQNIPLRSTEIYDAFRLLSEKYSNSTNLNINDFMSDVDVTQN